jgi:hypothetical protein
MRLGTSVKKTARNTPIWAVFIIALLVLLPISYFVGHTNGALPDAFNLPDQTVSNHLPSYPHSKATFSLRARSPWMGRNVIPRTRRSVLMVN